jgi:hypothetical protein
MAEIGGSRVQGSLGYIMRPHLKHKKKKRRIVFLILGIFVSVNYKRLARVFHLDYLVLYIGLLNLGLNRLSIIPSPGTKPIS